MKFCKLKYLSICSPRNIYAFLYIHNLLIKNAIFLNQISGTFGLLAYNLKGILWWIQWLMYQLYDTLDKLLRRISILRCRYYILNDRFILHYIHFYVVTHRIYIIFYCLFQKRFYLILTIRSISQTNVCIVISK